jgi:hypothetical protein
MMDAMAGVRSIMEEQKKKDWTSILAPTFLGIIISCGVNAGGAAWYFGSLNQRVAALEKLHDRDTQMATRNDLSDRDVEYRIYKQEMDLRLNRMDDKLDRILENQVMKGGEK